jgi:hypothetical protein
VAQPSGFKTEREPHIPVYRVKPQTRLQVCGRGSEWPLKEAAQQFFKRLRREYIYALRKIKQRQRVQSDEMVEMQMAYE